MSAKEEEREAAASRVDTDVGCSASGDLAGTDDRLSLRAAVAAREIAGIPIPF